MVSIWDSSGPDWNRLLPKDKLPELARVGQDPARHVVPDGTPAGLDRVRVHAAVHLELPVGYGRIPAVVPDDELRENVHARDLHHLGRTASGRKGRPHDRPGRTHADHARGEGAAPSAFLEFH